MKSFKRNPEHLWKTDFGNNVTEFEKKKIKHFIGP